MIEKASLGFEGASAKGGKGMFVASHSTLHTRPKDVCAKRIQFGGSLKFEVRWMRQTNPIRWNRAGPATMPPQECRKITPYGVTTNPAGAGNHGRNAFATKTLHDQSCKTNPIRGEFQV